MAGGRRRPRSSAVAAELTPCFGCPYPAARSLHACFPGLEETAWLSVTQLPLGDGNKEVECVGRGSVPMRYSGGDDLNNDQYGAQGVIVFIEDAVRRVAAITGKPADIFVGGTFFW